MIQRLRDAIVRRRLVRRITKALKAHETHRPEWRRDPDGFYRCPQCEPQPPAKGDGWTEK